MQHGHLLPAWILVFTCLVGGCTDRQPTATATATAPKADIPTDAWRGRWNGPEGTFLLIEGQNGNYKVTIQNLDGPQEFEASSAGAQIQFQRNGVKETIRATNGAQTGMKWLADKTHCLTVRMGEGYCRD